MAIITDIPTLGPAAAASPTTLVEYLVSISKESFYGIYIPGVGMAPNSNGSGGTVTTGNPVGCWAAAYASNWTAKFIQATAAARPQYSTSASAYGPVIQGNGTSWGLYCDSSTAFNLDCTILASIVSDNLNGYAWVHGSDQWSWYMQTNNIPQAYWVTVEGGDSLDQAHSVVKPTGGAAWTRRRKSAISSGVGTGRYGGVFRLLSGNGTYFSNVKILQFAVVPKLTESECRGALQFLAG